MESNKILLISANTYGIPYKVYPIGASYIKTYIHDHFPDWQVDLFDFNFNTYDSLRQQLLKKQYDLIALSLRNSDDVNYYAQESFMRHYHTICQTIRENSSTPIVAGGPAVSIFPQEISDYLGVDYLVVGEGEKVLCDLSIALKNKKEIDTVTGIWKNNNSYKKTEYVSHLNVQFEPELARFYLDEGGMLNIQTKRGCPFHCIYCTYPLIEGKTVRTLDSKLIVENIKELSQIEKNIYLFFTDSVFNIHEDYNEELAHRIIESGVKIRWGAYFIPKNLNKKRLELYQKSGLTHIEFGTDSFSDQQLINYRKEFKFSDVIESSEICNQVGIFHSHFLILGGIGETEESLLETIQNSDQLENTIIFPFIGMRIYPNTELHHLALQEGKINNGNLLEPQYYLSDSIPVNQLKDLTARTKNRWIFPDEPHEEMIARLRRKKRRGPLWEYLKYQL